MDFGGKRVLVTGGTRGIGRAVVEGFLAAGARVAINGTGEQSVAAALGELAAGEAAVPAPGSVATVDGCFDAVDAALRALGGLDVLVNNAGASSRGVSIDDADEAHWDQVVNTNLRGTYFCTKYAVAALREASGNVVNISSTWGLVGEKNASTYCASKGGVVNLTRALALELAPEVRVNCVCPGAVRTDMLEASATRMAADADAGFAMMGEQTPIGRVGEPRELATAVLYLACEELASFVTGAIHAVDGGDSA